jgi:hypothetical protein
MTTATNGRIHVCALKRAASGRWAEILSRHAGIAVEVLDGRHHPCPKCGGKDRFRALDDFGETGAVLCNQCFNQNSGDGFAALQHFAGIDFKAAVQLVADYLGMGNGKSNHGKGKGGGKQDLRKAVTELPAESWLPAANQYATAKPPITAEGIDKCAGKLLKWSDRKNNYTCFGFAGCDPIGTTKLAAIVLVRTDGKLFPAAGTLSERKTHNVRGSKNSWLSSGSEAQLQTATTILDLEGITDWLAAVSAGLPPGWVAVTNTAGAKARGKLPRPWAASEKIIVAGDADEPGQEGMKRAAAAYHQTGAAQVLLSQLPYPIEKDHGKDIRDWLLEGNKITDLPTVTVSSQEAEEWGKKLRHSSDKPLLLVTTDEEIVADEAIRALSTRLDVYQRGGILVHVVRDQDPPRGIIRPHGAPRIRGLSRATLRERMASSAAWVRPGGEDEVVPCHVPEWAVKAVDQRGTWREIRQLEVVTETPLFRADGTILQTPGYDATSGILYEPATDFPPVSDRPTLDEAKRALQQLSEVWADVPFASQTDLAVVIALTLTPLAHHSYRGPSPLFAIESNTRGAGKTLTADASGIISTGRALARASAPSNNDEARKLITSVVLAGERMILFDNIGEMFGWPALDAALTGTTWSDRILGANRMLIDAPLTTVWVATGNNMMFCADVVRRTLLCRLESLDECPEERSGFRHPDLISWVTENRGKLVSYALTILRGYHVAGRPPMGLKPFGSFEGWSAAVREPVVWAGLPDPAGSRRELAQRADQDAIGLGRLIEGWSEIDPNGAGLTVAEAMKLLDDDPNSFTALRSAITELVPARSGKAPSSKSIGMKIHHLRRRVIGGRYLDKRDTRIGAVWFVSTIPTCGTNGTSATISSPSQVRTGAHARTRENSAMGENSPASPASGAPAGGQSSDGEAREWTA